MLGQEACANKTILKLQFKSIVFLRQLDKLLLKGSSLFLDLILYHSMAATERYETKPLGSLAFLLKQQHWIQRTGAGARRAPLIHAHGYCQYQPMGIHGSVLPVSSVHVPSLDISVSTWTVYIPGNSFGFGGASE